MGGDKKIFPPNPQASKAVLRTSQSSLPGACVWKEAPVPREASLQAWGA